MNVLRQDGMDIGSISPAISLACSGGGIGLPGLNQSNQKFKLIQLIVTIFEWILVVWVPVQF